MAKHWTVFDVETAPLPVEQLEEIIPPFVAEDVKCGNMKDPIKIADKIAQAEANHRDNFIRDAALDPGTGRVLAIGCYFPHEDKFTLDASEEFEMLCNFWTFTEGVKVLQYDVAGVNIFGFDLPFLVKRSWMLGVRVPPWTVDLASHYPKWHPMFFDLRVAWQLGNKQAKSSFDHIGLALGTGGKAAGDHGVDFHKLWETDRETAIAYLKNDVEQPARWLEIMGLV